MKMPQIGPATLVTAAFIGPGTITACTLAGVNFGHSLMWAVLFSIIATVILQEMSARLGIVAQQGLGEVLRREFDGGSSRILMIGLVVSAVFVGNAAYEGGNITGAMLGMEALIGVSGVGWTIVEVAVVIAFLATSSYRLIERLLIGLVGVMSVAFILTAVLVGGDILTILGGLLIPSMPDGSTLTIIALVGTTVVPYSLFLHASAVQAHWSGPQDLPAARQDIGLSLSLGGLISLAIISTAAAAFFGKQIEVTSGVDMAYQLEPLLGDFSHVFMGAGLLAAGTSSAITAPLAAAYAVSGVLGWPPLMNDRRFRAVWLVIVISGLLIATTGIRPLRIIWFAQIANGILLPVLAIFLLKVMNSKTILGEYRNSRRQNALGGLVILVSLMLGTRSVLAALGWL